MVTLYQIAQSNKGIVVGTGNKVEDFGVGFYTKYGDGGVDISPIADYEQTEEAMNNSNSKYYDKYLKIREPNLHKMKPIPVCIIPKD